MHLAVFVIQFLWNCFFHDFSMAFWLRRMIVIIPTRLGRNVNRAQTAPVNTAKIMEVLGRTHTGTGRIHELQKDPNQIRNLFATWEEWKKWRQWPFSLPHQSQTVSSWPARFQSQAGSGSRRGELEYYCVTEHLKMNEQHPGETVCLVLFTMLWIHSNCVSLSHSRPPSPSFPFFLLPAVQPSTPPPPHTATTIG